MTTSCEPLISTLAKNIAPDDNTALIGIHTGGAWVAQAINQQLASPLPLGTLDISFYRDDFSTKGLHPNVHGSNINFDIDNKRVILVDDVLFTGRSIRAALTELFDFGRPSCVQLAVLIERGGRELPIQADFIGTQLALESHQYVNITGPSPICYEITS